MKYSDYRFEIVSLAGRKERDRMILAQTKMKISYVYFQ